MNIVTINSDEVSFEIGDLGPGNTAKLYIENGVFKFIGDADAAAKIFFNCVRKHSEDHYKTCQVEAVQSFVVQIMIILRG